jgi:HAD superfamily hydrolase (TIGR01459 family)
MLPTDPQTDVLPAIVTVDGLAAQFDGLLIDIWGVVHDGRTVFPGVTDALTRLGQAGIGRVLLSNSSRPAAVLARMLADFGIEPQHYDAIVSSGEACKVELERMTHPLLAGQPRRAVYIGDDYDFEWIRPLGLDIVTDVRQAAFVLLTSIEELPHSIEHYVPVLTAAAERGLPLLCANPDRAVLIAGALRMGSGTLGDLYADLGGTVVWFGKPHPAVYALALERLTALGTSRICAIGDALETDVRGAHSNGIKAALVPGGGVHRTELGLAFAGLPETGVQQAFFAKHGTTPDFLLAAFR